MSKIFICYRRQDSSDVTGRIFDQLKGKFGAGTVFKDVDSIPYGLDFRKVLGEAVHSCDVLLAIVGDDWLDMKAGSGRRRIDDPDDYVHIEIAAALEREIPVIPVLVEGTSMPRPDELPEALRPFAYRNAAWVRADPDFHGDMDRLCLELGKHLRPGKPSVLASAFARPWLAAIGLAGVVLLAIALASALRPRSKTIEAGAVTSPGQTGSPDLKKDDTEVLQGTWSMVSLIHDGKGAPAGRVDSAKLVVEGDRFAPTVGGRTVPYTFKLDPSAKPKAIDITHTDGNFEGQSVKGIYRLDGDIFVMCRAYNPAFERPERFSSETGSGQVLTVWERKKP